MASTRHLPEEKADAADTRALERATEEEAVETLLLGLSAVWSEPEGLVPRATVSPPDAPAELPVGRKWKFGGHWLGDETVSRDLLGLSRSTADRLDVRVRPGKQVFLNGQPAPTTDFELRSGDVLRAGRTLFVAHFLATEPDEGAGDELESTFLGFGHAATTVRRRIRDYAGRADPVLIFGETGTGKELVAQGLHRLSGRPGAEPWTRNCATLHKELAESQLFGHERGAFTSAVKQQKGDFELAGAGTLFLDEIGELPDAIQPKLLRVLETGEFNRVGGAAKRKSSARVVAATLKDLPAMAAGGTFRQDLLARLMVFVIRVPPLAEHKEDIPLLVEHFAAQTSSTGGAGGARFGIDDLEAMLAADWPWNVRQLRNFVASAASSPRTPGGQLRLSASDRRTLESFRRDTAPAPLAASSPASAGPADRRRPLEFPGWLDLAEHLARHEWNVTHAMKAAGRARNYVKRKREEFGIDSVDELKARYYAHLAESEGS